MRIVQTQNSNDKLLCQNVPARIDTSAFDKVSVTSPTPFDNSERQNSAFKNLWGAAGKLCLIIRRRYPAARNENVAREEKHIVSGKRYVISRKKHVADKRVCITLLKECVAYGKSYVAVRIHRFYIVNIQIIKDIFRFKPYFERPPPHTPNILPIPWTRIRASSQLRVRRD